MIKQRINNNGFINGYKVNVVCLWCFVLHTSSYGTCTLCENMSLLIIYINIFTHYFYYYIIDIFCCCCYIKILSLYNYKHPGYNCEEGGVPSLILNGDIFCYFYVQKLLLLNFVIVNRVKIQVLELSGGLSNKVKGRNMYDGVWINNY